MVFKCFERERDISTATTGQEGGSEEFHKVHESAGGH